MGSKLVAAGCLIAAGALWVYLVLQFAEAFGQFVGLLMAR